MTDKNTSDKPAKSKGDAGRDARVKDSPAAAAVKSETTGSGSHSSPKKRRKVNHGELFICACVCDRGSMLYLSRSFSPAMRCVALSPRGLGTSKNMPWANSFSLFPACVYCRRSVSFSILKIQYYRIPAQPPGFPK